jgi:preprotein translocase subunit SecE
MARIRPAKSQSENETGSKVTPPPAAPPPGRRRPTSTKEKERQPSRVRPAPAGKGVAKSGSVTKAVQVNRASRFFSEVVAELRKVSWPTRPALLQSTAVVIICVAVVAAYLGVLDEIFQRFVDAVF